MNRGTVTLQCVRAGSKLRIRFYSFTNEEGKIYTNVYDNQYNCQFPRDIRQEGRFYQINSDDIALVAGNGKNPFYSIRKTNIRILPHGPDDALLKEAPEEQVLPSKKKMITTKKENLVKVPAQIFEVNECVICMSTVSDTIFLPCAHRCTCNGCYNDLKKHSRCPACPLCRRTIINAINN